MISFITLPDMTAVVLCCFSVCVLPFSTFVIKINFLLCPQEDEDRRKYIEAMKAEEAKKANESKDEL